MLGFRRCKVWFCLIAYFVAYGSAQGAVLCTGTDGHLHVKMELVKKAGSGRARNVEQKITEDFIDYVEHVKIEVAWRDELVEQIVKTIEANPHTGLR